MASLAVVACPRSSMGDEVVSFKARKESGELLFGLLGLAALSENDR